MGSLWIKQPANAAEVTGSVAMVLDEPKDELNAGRPQNSVGSQTQGLKHTSGGILLSPQPQDDPNDPLNWPMWRRDISLFTVTIFALLAGGQTPMLAPVMGTLGKQFDKPLHDLTYLVGVFMASMGVGSALLAPLAVKYGKRPVYLGSLLVFFAGLVWGANATSYNSLMGARVLSGIGCSPAESLPSTTIAEIYFAHERAYRIGIYTLLLLGGKNLSPLASGFTAHRLGWHWIFWVAAIICGASFAAMFFFVHETWWERSPTPDKRSVEESQAARRVREYRLNNSIEVHDVLPPPDAAHTTRPNSLDDFRKDEMALGDNMSQLSPDASQAPSSQAANILLERRPFLHNLAVFTGPKTSAGLGVIFLRPMMLYAYLPVLYATLVYGTSVVWLSVIAETISSIFTHEPYNFRTTSVGLLYIATFIGGVFGSLVAGRMSDVLVRVMCRRNGGMYEPEFRLVMILPVMITITIGLMGFGWATHAHDKWIVPAIFLGFLGFGTSLASTVSITYVVDCYRKFALEALVSLNFAKNMMGLGFSIFVPYFFEASGSKISFVVYGCVEIGLCLLAIPMYRYGKVCRSWYDRKKWIDKLYT